ncbi:cation:proton antiporter domain-containing protein [Rhodovulum adriaticum]|uniref:Kef-type potassium/proton antiporter (CPA2 family) n=1 Tax=Rhodovulum adriaticum TaxID=35804 RepID=A0A4R2NXD1_RHOAD|nr:cation:proton antiporter [Rhodovulum adriaticum]MBK1636317.1 potassium transporter [Rhodovulum adriaticum]TCP26318.1 Kef-type potassium/proton antiporter (CPA2 family) [Rhodovulum adriaticum]
MDGFLFQATLYLGAIVLIVPIASRLGLGSVLGYLLIGILFGPVLGLTGAEMDSLRHFAEIGVVMMLFLIGLELEPRVLWAMRDKLIGLGGLQVTITLALVTGAAMVFGQEWRPALAMGMIFALSSTAIVLQTLSEKKLINTPGGRSAFSVLLMQDIAVIPMLAVMPFLALPGHGGDHGAEAGHHGAVNLIAGLPAWGVALVTLGAVVGTVLAGSFLVRPLFRFVQAARLRELNTAMALVIVAGIASVMLTVGLSPALGTFLAGVVLANSEFRHELESSIEPFKGLLLGLFFITVGAGMDFSYVREAPVLVPVYVVGLVLIKVAVLYALALMFKLDRDNRWLFTLGLAQAGEFGFVLSAFALSQNILPEEIANMSNLVIALSMLITPALFITHELLVRWRARPAGEKPEHDSIEERHPVIIAGMGRFGLTVHRIVTMTGAATTVMDHDLRVVQRMRKLGIKTYYGDPTRPELLASAGIENAEVLVVCLGDHDASTKLVAHARRVRPDIHIVARARDRVHAYELLRAGANDIARELFDSALRTGRHVIQKTGLTPVEAENAERTFFEFDRAALRDLSKVWKPGVPIEDNAEYMELSRALDEELANALARAPLREAYPRRHTDDAAPQILDPEAETDEETGKAREGDG